MELGPAAARATDGAPRPVAAPAVATGLAPAGFEEIEQHEFARLFGQMIAARVMFLPAILLAIAGVTLVESAPWRRLFLIVTAVSVTSFFVIEVVRFRRHGITPWSIPLNLVVAIYGQLAVTAATGGLESPLLFVAVPLGFISAIALRGPLRLVLAASQAVTFLGFAAVQSRELIPDFVPKIFGGGASPANLVQLWASAAAISFVVLMATVLGRALRRTFENTIRRSINAQEESLRAHVESARELWALSGEIAHELKNPLASVKGLTGLLAQSITDDKAAERLGVVKREVDRMQAILEEFLNFSRPLVPLAIAPTDLVELAREVVALHEGLGHERDLELVVAGESHVIADCDPRKVKQVLINLVQNAIDASPRGGTVELRCESGVIGAAAGGAGAGAADSVCVRVLDDGAGVDPSLGERVFAPGVTTKERGSGLGLTIARAMARQHGGELTLAPRPDGGTEACLRLPRRAVGTTSKEAAS